MKKMFVCLMALAMTATMSAQSYVGMDLGYSWAPSMIWDGDDELTEDYDNKLDISATFFAGKQLFSAASLYGEIGFGFDYKQFTENTDIPLVGDCKNVGSIMSLDVPVRLAYLITVNQLTVKPFAGIGARFNVSAKNKTTIGDDTETINCFDEDDLGDDTWKRFGAFYTFGATVGYRGYTVGLNYIKDFTEIYDDVKLNNGLAVTLGIQF